MDKAEKLARLALDTKHDGEALSAGLALARLILKGSEEPEKPELETHIGYTVIHVHKLGPQTDKAALMLVGGDDCWVPFSQMWEEDVDVVMSAIPGKKFDIEVTDWWLDVRG